MSHGDGQHAETCSLDELIDEILMDAYGDDEHLWAFRQAIEDGVSLPADVFVIGQPVSVHEIDYDGNTRRGLTATCERPDGVRHVVALADVAFPPGRPEARLLAAYRRWLGLEPAGTAGGDSPPARRHQVTDDDIDLEKPVDLIVLKVMDQAARCRVLGTHREVTLRSGSVWAICPGEIVTVCPRKFWQFSGHPFLSGDVESRRTDVSLLELTPLRLLDQGLWNPEDEYWGEEGDPIEDWARLILERGPRPAFEMEKVIPGEAPEDPFDDPILRSVELKEMGAFDEAHDLLMELTHADLRCLDAHSHLGNLIFERHPGSAITHYDIGRRIGELSLGEAFGGVLLWGLIDNRPYLRCLHGYGLCLWRLGRFEEAEDVFERMLRLNPSDNQGARFLLGPVREHESWEEREGIPR